jgi:hypothetical protein
MNTRILHLLGWWLAACAAVANPRPNIVFVLADDPNESRDLAGTRPDLVRELRSRYDAYATAAVPLLDGEPPAGFKTPAVWGEFPRR